MTLSRRAFLGTAGGVTLGAALGGRYLWANQLSEHLEQSVNQGPTPSTSPTGGAPGRVLVLVQLNGGNDGLNTLVPAGDGEYHDNRPTLAIADADVVALRGTDRYGLHPALKPLLAPWEAGRMAAVDGVGLPGQSRSHFAAQDAWSSAQPGSAIHTGWIGRWLDATGPSTDPLRAIVLGGGASVVRADQSMATSVLDPASFAVRAPKGSDANAIRDAFLATSGPGGGDALVDDARRAIPAALAGVDILAKARGGAVGSSASSAPATGGLVATTGKGDDATSISSLLTTAAGIIDLGIGTQVIVVVGNNFDTHSDQAARHQALLADLGSGVAGFLDTIAAQGRRDDVLVMTTSEFGRRVHENGSGTDHGNGSAHFLFGPVGSGGAVTGQADLGALDQGDLRSLVDTRSLYAASLDWLGGSPAVTDQVLGGPYDRLGLVSA